MKKHALKWWWRRVTGTLIQWSCPEPDCYFRMTTDSWVIRERVVGSHRLYHENEK